MIYVGAIVLITLLITIVFELACIDGTLQGIRDIIKEKK